VLGVLSVYNQACDAGQACTIPYDEDANGLIDINVRGRTPFRAGGPAPRAPPPALRPARPPGVGAGTATDRPPRAAQDVLGVLSYYFVTCPSLPGADGCAADPCFAGVECTDVDSPWVGFSCGGCPDGYFGDGLDCRDYCYQGFCVAPPAVVYPAEIWIVGDGPFYTLNDLAIGFTGAALDDDWIGLFAAGVTPGQGTVSHDWDRHGSAAGSGSMAVRPSVAGEYFAVMLRHADYTELSARVAVSIVDDPDYVPSGTVSIAGDGPFNAGAELTIDYTGAVDSQDWIGLFLVDHDTLWTVNESDEHDFAYTSSESVDGDGSVAMTPRTAGEYFVVMLCCDGYTEVSERASVTVVAAGGGGGLAPAPAPSPAGDLTCTAEDFTVYVSHPLPSSSSARGVCQPRARLEAHGLCNARAWRCGPADGHRRGAGSRQGRDEESIVGRVLSMHDGSWGRRYDGVLSGCW
jgi:hypothetical protein